MVAFGSSVHVFGGCQDKTLTQTPKSDSLLSLSTILSSSIISNTYPFDEKLLSNPNTNPNARTSAAANTNAHTNTHPNKDPNCQDKRWLNDVIVLDTDRWAWSHPHTTGVAPLGCSYHTARMLGDSMYVIGGNDDG